MFSEKFKQISRSSFCLTYDEKSKIAVWTSSPLLSREGQLDKNDGRAAKSVR